MLRRQFSKTNPFLLWLLSVLLLGLFFRFANLGSKVFWVDEVATAMRLSGYTVQSVIEQVAAQGTVSVAELRQYLSPTPQDFKTTLAVFKQSPEHAPLYFLLARFWVQHGGNSPAALRSLSALVSLLTFPGLYWLCWELWQSARVGVIALMLLSVSPFYVTYAQEARPYSLWTVTILLSGAALLRAIRLGTRRSWMLYAVTLVLGFYTFLLSIVVAVGQGIYVAVQRTVFKEYLLAIAASVIAFIPWLLVIGQHWQALQDNTTWMREPLALPAMIAIWVASILLTFGDLPIPTTIDPIAIVGILVTLVGLISIFLVWFGLKRGAAPRRRRSTHRFALLIAGALILGSTAVLYGVDLVTIVGVTSALGVLILVVVSLSWLYANTPYRTWGFVLAWSFLPFVLIVSDLITAGQRSTAPRYLIPAQLGLIITVAGFLATRRSQVCLALLLSLGLVSCLLNVNQSPKYQKGQNVHNPALAAAINQAQSPTLFAAAADVPNLISLSADLQPGVTIRIVPEVEYYRNRNVFLFNPSEAWRQQLGDRIEPVYQPQRYTGGEITLSLWQVKNVRLNEHQED
ncbi:MAG: glycosyltransferase family 39 protein [Cyanophyceae cyanobacterium]